MHISELQFGEAIGNSTGLCIDSDISVSLKGRRNQRNICPWPHILADQLTHRDLDLYD